MPTQEPPIVHALRFRWLTPAYDLVVAATTRERTVKAALLAQARIASTHRVLDLASGTGTLAILAKRRQPGAEIIGIDADPAIISIARSKAQGERVDVRFDQGRHLKPPRLLRRAQVGVGGLGAVTDSTRTVWKQ